MPPKRNLIGKTFGFLTVVAEAPHSDRVRWLARCVCGRTTITQTTNLTLGHTRGCNHCTRKGHRETGTPLYTIWSARVSSKHGCCKAWKKYETFRDWAIAHGWRQGLWVHRKADQGEYSPRNCFIAPRRWQAAFGTSPNAKLLPTDIPVIRQLANEGWTQTDIAKRFGVHGVTINDIFSGRSWK